MADRALQLVNFEAGETLGGWCAIPNSLTAEIVGRAGFDWVCVDTQHGPIGVTEMSLMLQALAAAGCPSLVRVASNEPSAIYRALDAGASGVIVPMVNTSAEAQAASNACRYPPIGDRSYGPNVSGLRIAGLSADQANRDVSCIVQVETEEALGNLDSIAGVDGITALFVGPSDLALSLGTPLGDLDNATFRAACRDVVAASQAHGRVAGIFCGTTDAARVARSDGFTMLAIQSDIRFLRAAAAGALRELLPDPRFSRLSNDVQLKPNRARGVCQRMSSTASVERPNRVVTKSIAWSIGTSLAAPG